MFLISWNLLTSLLWFAFILWFSFALTFTIYLYPRLVNTNTFKLTFFFKSFNFLIVYFIFIFIYFMFWVSPTAVIWYGHLTCFTLTFKYTVSFTLVYTLTLYIYDSWLKVFNKISSDLFILLVNMYPWFVIAAYSTNIYTLIFILELLVILLFLFIPISTFIFVNKSRLLPNSSYFNSNSILPLLNSLLFYYWMSFVSSTFLFLVNFFMFFFFLSFEWFTIDYLALFNVTTSAYLSLKQLYVVVLIMLLVFFIKFGLMPFFLWKLVVFKGLTFQYIFLYVSIYFNVLLYIFFLYFYIYLFNLYFILSFLTYFLIVTTLPFTLIYLFNYNYVKSFIAISSLFNTSLILLMLNSQLYI